MKLFDNDKDINIIDFSQYCIHNYNLVEECYKNIWIAFKEILNSYLNISVKKFYKENFGDDIIKYLSLYKE
jgi:hypothetical protein